jgi:hypothetical protein
MTFPRLRSVKRFTTDEFHRIANALGEKELILIDGFLCKLRPGCDEDGARQELAAGLAMEEAIESGTPFNPPA